MKYIINQPVWFWLIHMQCVCSVSAGFTPHQLVVVMSRAASHCVFLSLPDSRWRCYRGHAQPHIRQQTADTFSTFRNTEPPCAPNMTRFTHMFCRRARLEFGRLLGAALSPCRCFHAERVRTSTHCLTEHCKHSWFNETSQLPCLPDRWDLTPADCLLFTTVSMCVTFQPITGSPWRSSPGFYTVWSRIRSLQRNRWVTHWWKRAHLWWRGLPI